MGAQRKGILSAYLSVHVSVTHVNFQSLQLTSSPGSDGDIKACASYIDQYYAVIKNDFV